MGYLGKVIAGAGIGVVAIAAAPFTGGGSLFAGATLASSLAGVGTIVAATGAGVVGATTGAVIESIREDEEMENIKSAKKCGFEDGVNEGKAMTVEEIKKYADFYLATTALSYYVARCDGTISDKEQLEIDFDLDAIVKNVDISDSIKKEMHEIKNNVHLTFEDVKAYLDKVSIATLEKLSSDVTEIIKADGVVTETEREAEKKFEYYVRERKHYE